jgi:hypothetical protein
MGINIVARLLGLDEEPKQPVKKERIKGYYKIPKPNKSEPDQDDEVIEDESE